MSQEVIGFTQHSPVDLDAVALVLVRASAERDGLAPPDEVHNPMLAADLRERLARPGAWIDIARADDKVVGFALGYPSAEADGIPADDDTEYLSLLFVDPDYWGRRIASRLLDSAAERVRTDDKRRIMLWTRKNGNAHARRFYEHKGYMPTGMTRSSKHGEQILYLLDVRWATD
jgi:GNAT superfamily N-acetyltransferase